MMLQLDINIKDSNIIDIKASDLAPVLNGDSLVQ